VKTRNIRRYLHDEPLAHPEPAQPWRGASRLARWLFFADQGEFRTSDFEMIMNNASCLSRIGVPLARSSVMRSICNVFHMTTALDLCIQQRCDFIR
jgi:hypothetical protein